ncbi:hypothetical protein ACVFI8_08210 [Agarivorans sp. MS3-6]
MNKAQQALTKAYNTGRNLQHMYALCDMKVSYKNAKATTCIMQLHAVALKEVIEPLKQ